VKRAVEKIMKKSILVVAGEVSGDLHAADVIRRAGALSPETGFWGIGGNRLAAEGVELVEHVDRMSVMGLPEVLKRYRFFRRVFRQVLKEAEQRGTKTALLVDYPGFNLRLAAALKKRGVRVVYYISPKVWAWNKRRIPRMVEVIDRLMVIFPFEVDVFAGTGLQVDYVGNPLVEQLDRFLVTEPKALPWKSERRIALLPGSRRQEIERILPAMLEAAWKLENSFPELSFMIATPNQQIERTVKGKVFTCRYKPSRLSIICGNARELMRQAEAAIVTSGTATLETALIGTPHILVYRTSALTYWFARLVVKISYIGLVNIVAGRSVCPELIQHEAAPERLAEETARLLSDTPERKAMLEGYAEIRRRLGGKKASDSVAEAVLHPAADAPAE
jgi:lipid-A-disaccharide synthase